MSSMKTDKIMELMKQLNIDWYMVPTGDCHNSEYVDEYFKCRQFLSGFLGSNGTLLYGPDGVRLWTDGRYFIQAEKELEGSDIKLMKMGEKGVPTIKDYLALNAVPGQVLGFDGRVCTAGYIDALAAANPGLVLKGDADLVGSIWEDRPPMTCRNISVLSMEYCGRSVLDKLEDVRRAMKEAKCSYHLISKLDDIMWLFNIRGSDIEYNPVAYSYAFITMKDVYLFVKRAAVSPQLTLYARINNIVLMDYEIIEEFLEDFDYELGSYRDEEQTLEKENGTREMSDKKLMFDSSELNYHLRSIVCRHCETLDVVNPTTLFKAVKNETEIENMRKYFLNDSLAVTRFMYWLDTQDRSEISECDAAKRLDDLRRELEDFKGQSFETIAAYGDNGAIVHYEPHRGTDKMLDNKGMLLVDSGGQYPSATTDVTRTSILGPITAEEMHDYTLVAKGWLNLMYAHFPAGVTGRNLDILARGAMWREGRDYNHGTGHGVGCFLNVHEGPVGIRYKYVKSAAECVLEPGMVVTDEPGIYVEGKYGIRTENTLLVVNAQHEGYYCFEPLTLVPLDMRGIDMNMLNIDEVEYLGHYQKKVYEALSPYLTQNEKAWLENIITAR